MPGDHSREETPVPIPNTEVKLPSADGTARVTVWESKSSPGFLLYVLLIYSYIILILYFINFEFFITYHNLS
jgi:hypothetical protein